MAKAKTSNPNTKLETLSKDCSWLDYMQADSFRFFPGKTEWRKRLIYTMYASLDEADKKGREPIDLMQLCRKYKIKYTTLLHWTTIHDDIKEAYEDYKLFLACNRRLGTMHRELDKEAVYKDQHKYDPEWHTINKYHAALAAEAKKNAEDVEEKVIVIERMPSTHLVPEKK